MSFDISNITNAVASKASHVKLLAQKNAPAILLGVGIVSVVGGTICACRATIKAQDILEEFNKTKETIDHCEKHDNNDGAYTHDDAMKDRALNYTQTAVKLVKVYLPAIGLGVFGIGCLIGSHHILNKRNLAIAAAFKATDGAFKEYRQRVVEKFGENLDRELRYNVETKKVEVTEKDEEGVEKTVEVEREVPKDGGYSEYAVIFDEYSTQWQKDPYANIVFLRAQQEQANAQLRYKGHIFLNEIYDMLGLPRTQAGQVVGWVYDEKSPMGDNYVDFGLFDLNPERFTAGGMDNFGYVLDFNVDGIIWDLI